MDRAQFIKLEMLDLVKEAIMKKETRRSKSNDPYEVRELSYDISDLNDLYNKIYIGETLNKYDNEAIIELMLSVKE